MWKVSNWIWVICTGPLVITGLVLLYFGLTAVPGFIEIDGDPDQATLLLMGGAFIVFPLLTAAGVYLFYKTINDREAYLLKEGIRGHARILHREMTGVYLNDQPQVRFALEVTLPGKAPYRAEHKEVIPIIDVGKYNEGQTVAVAVDPRDPKKMIFA